MTLIYFCLSTLIGFKVAVQKQSNIKRIVRKPNEK